MYVHHRLEWVQEIKKLIAEFDIKVKKVFISTLSLNSDFAIPTGERIKTIIDYTTGFSDKKRELAAGNRGIAWETVLV